MRRLWYAVALAAALMPAPGAAGSLSFDQALSLAVERSEAVRAAQASAAGAHESARAAGQLPDPMLHAGVENLPVTGADRFSTTKEPMTMKRFALSQEWLSADKRRARTNAAQAAADREAIQVAAAQADARLQVALAYLDAWYARGSLKLAMVSERYFQKEQHAALARLASASARSADVLQRTAASGMAKDESAEVRQEEARAIVALQRWVGFQPDALAPVPRFNVPIEADFIAGHPLVAALRREAEVARRNAAVAAHERTPNWTLEVAYGRRPGSSSVVSIGVSVPLQIAPARRQDRETAAKLALVDRVDAELAEATRAAAAEYRSLASDLQRLLHRVERYRTDVGAAAAQHAAAAMAAYRSKQAPLSSMYEARRAWVEVQRKLLSLERELARAEAQLSLKPLAHGSAE